ncbi:MAG TPA: 6-phosphogluconolactonase [Nocardioidaceae bacterium]|jgi:6-phosphogluconolactonase|nr:6-phosphogluconolactonase [Nocardioidaceae bacterium]
MAEPEVAQFESPDELAEEVAARLVARIVDLQSAGTVPSLVLTGGSIAGKIQEAVAAADADGIDWSRIDVWFGDERFVPEDDPDRNFGQAAAALLDRRPFDPARVHAMPPSDGKYGDDVDAAAAAYAEELREAAGEGDVPRFDVLMLGIGPDGHCASLFPGRPEIDDERPVVAVRNSPKPPPTRISFTRGPLCNASEVWLVASGSEKAEAVSLAVHGADPHDVPAAAPTGFDKTIWFLDDAAASRLG